MAQLLLFTLHGSSLTTHHGTTAWNIVYMEHNLYKLRTKQLNAIRMSKAQLETQCSDKPSIMYVQESTSVSCNRIYMQHSLQHSATPQFSSNIDTCKPSQLPGQLSQTRTTSMIFHLPVHVLHTRSASRRLSPSPPTLPFQLDLLLPHTLLAAECLAKTKHQKLQASPAHNPIGHNPSP